LSKDFAVKDPILPFNGGEVFLLDPFDGFFWVSAFCPLPESTEGARFLNAYGGTIDSPFDELAKNIFREPAEASNVLRCR
jgi:hypothetical protein